MPTFSYKAHTPDGNAVAGRFTAQSKEEATSALEMQNMTIASIEEIHSLPTKEAQTPTTEQPETSNKQPSTAQDSSYHSINDTLRLYAGWLLAWYALIYGLGYYQHTRELSFRIPYVEGLLLSPLVFSFALGSFLYLLWSSLHKLSGGGSVKGLLLGICGVASFSVYRMFT